MACARFICGGIAGAASIHVFGTDTMDVVKTRSAGTGGPQVQKLVGLKIAKNNELRA